MRVLLAENVSEPPICRDAHRMNVYRLCEGAILVTRDEPESRQKGVKTWSQKPLGGAGASCWRTLMMAKSSLAEEGVDEVGIKAWIITQALSI